MISFGHAFTANCSHGQSFFSEPFYVMSSSFAEHGSKQENVIDIYLLKVILKTLPSLKITKK